MKDLTSFDGTLEMFRDAPKPVNGAQLRFLRWLAEQGRLEHPVGPPASGEFADAEAPLTEGAAGWSIRSSVSAVARRALRRVHRQAVGRAARNRGPALLWAPPIGPRGPSARTLCTHRAGNACAGDLAGFGRREHGGHVDAWLVAAAGMRTSQ